MKLTTCYLLALSLALPTLLITITLIAAITILRSLGHLPH